MKPFRTPAPWLAAFRGSHLIQLDFYDGNRNLINIWLPELWKEDSGQKGSTKSHEASVKAALSSVLDRTEDRRFYVEDGRLITTYEMKTRFKLRGEILPIENGVSMKLSLTNLSNNNINPSIASVCVQFAAAPSFADSLLDRYFYVSRGKIVFVKGPYLNSPHPNSQENHVWFFGTSPDERFVHNPQPDSNFIGLTSKDSNWVAGLNWNSSTRIWGNCHPSMSCIHSDPHFEQIAPLETAKSTGVLFLMEGQPEDCVARFKEEFGNQYISEL